LLSHRKETNDRLPFPIIYVIDSKDSIINERSLATEQIALIFQRNILNNSINNYRHITDR
jgi:hypothetical protein